MRALTLLALAALCFPLATHAQEVKPEARGPFLLVEQDAGAVVMVSMAERRATAVGASATMVTFTVEENMLFRTDALVEANCTRRVRRTGTLFVQWVQHPDARPTSEFTAPAVGWSPPGPLDGPLMAFLCEDGRHDPTKVGPSPSTFVRPWLDGG